MATPEGTFRRRLLPHWDVEGKPYFITACLEGSIPASGMRAIRKHREELEQRPCPRGLDRQEWQLRKDKLLFAFVDRLLDHQSPVHHLANPQLASMVESAMLFFAGQRYELIAWCVMPSHYHWLFKPLESWAAAAREARSQQGKQPKSPRQTIQQSLQGYTARFCNSELGRSEQFWQHETWDHWVRDEEELVRIVRYIESNPVAARLVGNPCDWHWSSARVRCMTGIREDAPIPREVIRQPGQGN